MDGAATQEEPAYLAERSAIEARFGSEPWKRMDAIEAELEQMPQEDFPLNHVFTPGLYIREILLKKGTFLTSRIHLTEHPFIISHGQVSIWTEENGCITLQAPYTGVTKPGTRRILFAHTDVIFSTCHANPDNETNPDEIVKRLTYNEGKYRELGGAKA